MSMIRSVVMAAAAGLVGTVAAAQTPAPAPAPPFTMATYYRCDVARQERADTLYRQVLAPVLDRQIKAGNLTGYGFSSHRIGGVFRRLETITAPTLAKLIAGQDAYIADLEKTNPKGSAEFTAICGSHDDYIWNRVMGSAPPAPGTPAPAYSYSRYMGCELSKEQYADQIMETAYAPIMNKHLAAGHITGWGYFTHNLGGNIRRILNWSGPDVMAVLNAEEMISSDMGNHAAYTDFTAACNSHSDYVWRSEVTSP